MKVLMMMTLSFFIFSAASHAEDIDATAGIEKVKCSLFGNLKVKFDDSSLGMANGSYLKAKNLFGRKCKSIKGLFTSRGQTLIKGAIEVTKVRRQEFEYETHYGRNGEVYRRQIPVCRVYKEQQTTVRTPEITYEGQSFSFKGYDSVLINMYYGYCH